MTSDLIFTTVSLGLGVATSHRIGNLLGSGKFNSAKRACLAPYLLSLVIGLVEFIAIIALRHKYGYMFTSDRSVVAATAQILPLMAGFQILDLANGGAGGVLRGAGKNHLSGLCNLLAYYGVGLTTAWALCFWQKLGLWGLWMGIVTGSLALLSFQTFCIYLIKWNREAERIAQRIIIE
jgi:multidrug resistance protein, MATE family